MKPTYESPLASRYASKYMLHLFSPDSRFETWRRLWVALAQAQHDLGLPVTQEQVDELAAHVSPIDYDVVSKKEKEITDFILHEMHSGATIYEARGAYDNTVRREIIAIVSKSEYSKLMNFIARTDKDAFVTVYTVNEVLYRPKF